MMRAGRLALWIFIVLVLLCAVYVANLLDRKSLPVSEPVVTDENVIEDVQEGVEDLRHSGEASEADVRVPVEPADPLAVAFGSEPTKRLVESEVLLEILETYRSHLGSFPTGEDNAAIMKKLKGDNSRRLRVFPKEHRRYNSKGELEDGWGKPFFFHVIGSDHVQVRSAGPDGEMYTGDDLVVSNRPIK